MTSTCLNPYSNGRCPASRQKTPILWEGAEVLILVLMEDALRECLLSPDDLNGSVLILVLMEDALRE